MTALTNVERLEMLYDQADSVNTIVMRATLTELCRASQGGLTDSQIDYWCDRLANLLKAGAP